MYRPKWIAVALLVALLVPMAIFFLRSNPNAPGTEPLLVYCAGGMRTPMTAIAERYEEEFGIPIHLQFAGSGTLLGSIEASNTGDLYLAADSSYIEKGRKLGLVLESLPTAYLTAGLIVQTGNPKNIASLEDLRDREDVRITLGNPEAASIGKFTRKVLTDANLWEPISEKTLAMNTTVNHLANDVKLGAADVTIAWDAIAAQYPELEFISVPEFEKERKDVSIGVLNSAVNPAAALRFARYATASDRGLENFKRDHYDIIEDGDPWNPAPELVFFSGAMLQPAIRERLEEFEQREGATVRFVPNGCGILVSQMRAGARPDAYFSCDISFMDAVQDLFEPPTTVSANDVVLLVANHARDKITKLSDIALPTSRIGIAHPEKSALGALTVRLLESLNIDVSQSKQLDSATGDFLVNQLRAGSLDAVLVYHSNALAHPQTLKEAHILPIDHPDANARQPFAIGKASAQKHLAQRLFLALTSEDAKAGFQKQGFQWILNDPQLPIP